MPRKVSTDPRWWDAFYTSIPKLRALDPELDDMQIDALAAKVADLVMSQDKRER